MKKSSIIINETLYTVELIPRDRKTISMRMLAATKIEVRYPAYMSNRRIVSFIKKKKNWIEKKHQLLDEAGPAGTGIYEGRILYYMGNPYSVVFNNGEIKIHESLFLIRPGCDMDEIENWFRLKSEEAVKTFIEKNQSKIPECIIKVKRQKRIWGSCNSRKMIYINSRISMCSPKVIEYVLWHEISHLMHMNHSGNFYKQLAIYCPDFRRHVSWLKKNNHLLRI